MRQRNASATRGISKRERMGGLADKAISASASTRWHLRIRRTFRPLVRRPFRRKAFSQCARTTLAWRNFAADNRFPGAFLRTGSSVRQVPELLLPLLQEVHR